MSKFHQQLSDRRKPNRSFRYDLAVKSFANRVAKDVAIGLWAGLIAGLTSAVFLLVLAKIDVHFRNHHELIFILPVAGVISAALYKYLGGEAGRGIPLIVEAIHQPDRPVPWRMAPLVLIGTWFTHLGGGSAGREGTAVQMGGAIAVTLEKVIKLDPTERRRIVIASVAGAFGGVFGTPVAGSIFGIEATSKRWFEFDCIVNCAVAAFVGDWVARSCGITHPSHPPFLPGSIPWWSVVPIGIALALVARAFMASIHLFQRFTKPWPWYVPPLVGGSLVILATLATGKYDWDGLSLPLLERSTAGPVGSWDFAGKFAITVMTLGFGFKGGEITPLFVIGATCANAMAQGFGYSPEPWAMLGFVTLFGSCSGAPIACALMAGELFGWSTVGMALGATIVAAGLGPARNLYEIQRPWNRRATGPTETGKADSLQP